MSGDVRGQEDRVRDLGCEDQRGLQHPEEHQEAGGGERHEGEHQELVARGTGQGRQQETCEDELHTQVNIFIYFLLMATTINEISIKYFFKFH